MTMMMIMIIWKDELFIDWCWLEKFHFYPIWVIENSFSIFYFTFSFLYPHSRIHYISFLFHVSVQDKCRSIVFFSQNLFLPISFLFYRLKFSYKINLSLFPFVCFINSFSPFDRIWNNNVPISSLRIVKSF
jgi:hypothetical protein